MKCLGFVWGWMLLAMQCGAQDTTKLFSPAELKADLAIARAALTEAHPGLYIYHDSLYFAGRFRAVERQLTKPMSELAFYRLLNPLLAAIGCGHTKWHRDGRPDDLFAFYSSGLFPLPLYFCEGKAYLAKKNGAAGIPAGAEIVHVNGQGMSSIASRLLAHVLADGAVMSSRWQALSEQFAGYYATFIGPAPRFRVGYRVQGGTVKVKDIEAMKAVEATRFQGNVGNDHGPDTMRVTFPAAGVALMRIPVFVPQEGGPDWEDFLASAFHRIGAAGTQHLIIDLRNNEGGMDRWGAQLYAWLTDRPFRYYDRLNVVSDKELSFRQYATLPEQYDQLKAFIRQQGDEYVFTLHPNLGEQEGRSNAYKGKVYVLVNGRSFSVSGEFAAIVRDQHRGLFIGQESGGTIAGNNSGGFAIVRLPHTQLNLAIPLLRYHMLLNRKYQPGRGIVPDFPAVPTVRDLLAGRDVVLEKTLELIRTHR